jgi:superfamily II DNA or RNA helicase
LDEGVDVPAARIAILLASSTNPREYIQRIGRVIRRSQNKREAIIYDMIVAPSLDRLPPEMKKIESDIFQKEIKRCQYIAELAINNVEALKIIHKKIQES